MGHDVKGHILLIDSGVGGLVVLAQMRKLLPDAQYTYVADEAYFPYGKLDDLTLQTRVSAIVKSIDQEMPVDCVVVACNTASTIVLETLRDEYDFPIVGIVPAIKVAAQQTKTKVFGVIATEATANGAYIQSLINEFAADCLVILQGSKKLAKLAEQKLNGNKVLLSDVKKEIQLLFTEQGHLDHIVLGCTHYPFLLEELKAVVPYEVCWIDPAKAVANRVFDVFVPKYSAVVYDTRHFTTAEKSNYFSLKFVNFKHWEIG
ncbi:MAG: glutamate racemase [Rhizobiales bacterium]|nr:glutamate racemase [Hyphomicrobiales bacterium]